MPIGVKLLLEHLRWSFLFFGSPPYHTPESVNHVTLTRNCVMFPKGSPPTFAS